MGHNPAAPDLEEPGHRRPGRTHRTAGTTPPRPTCPPDSPHSRSITGRPPYGYRAPARTGDPPLCADPETAPVVQRIFAEYLGGSGLQAIAEKLTAAGIPRPSAHDQRRNPHHVGTAWSKAAVRAIITNDRYARAPAQCARCDRAARCRHQVQALVPGDTFWQAQDLLAERGGTGGGQRTPQPVTCRYLLRGRVRCDLCQRLMQGTWNNDAPYYRCRFPREYARANNIDHPFNVYLREERLVQPLHEWIIGKLPVRLDEWAARKPQPARVRLLRRVEEVRRLIATTAPGPGRDRAVYQALGIRLAYRPGQELIQVRAEVLPGATVLDHFPI